MYKTKTSTWDHQCRFTTSAARRTASRECIHPIQSLQDKLGRIFHLVEGLDVGQNTMDAIWEVERKESRFVQKSKYERRCL